MRRALELLEQGATLEMVSMDTGIGREQMIAAMRAAELDADGRYVDADRGPVYDGRMLRKAMGKFAIDALESVQTYSRTPRYRYQWLERLIDGGHWLTSDPASTPMQWSLYEAEVTRGERIDPDPDPDADS